MSRSNGELIDCRTWAGSPQTTEKEMLRKELQRQGDAASDATADADEEVLNSNF